MNIVLWSYNEKRSTGELCDDWKDQRWKRHRKAKRNDAGLFRAVARRHSINRNDDALKGLRSV